MGSQTGARSYIHCSHGNHPKYCTHCKREVSAVVRPVESTLCRHNSNRHTCERCKLPPIACCQICGALTQTLVTELHGNISSAMNPKGWPLCGNECAFRLKLWLQIQTPRDEGEPRGTVSPSHDCQPGSVRSVPDIIIGAGVEAPIS